MPSPANKDDYDPDVVDDLEDHALESAPSSERLHRLVAVFVVPFLAMGAYLLVPASDLSGPGRATLAMAVWMAGWWVTEAIPLAATALLPVAFFPLLGVSSIQESTAPYAHKLIFLFLGGFMMAQAMERWNLHRRMALVTVLFLGTSPRRLVAGFMVAVAFLSMWVSNTAAVIMMIPTGLSVVDLVSARLEVPENEGAAPGPERDGELFAAALLLGIAYAASFGGVATLIGTPPNALFAAFVEREYGTQFPFATWAALGVPVVLGFLPVAWWCLTRIAFPFQIEEIPGGREVLDEEYQALGPMQTAEKIVLGVFTVAALAWITRPLLQDAGLAGLDDASIAILGALSLFVLPAGTPDGERVLTWDVARHLPWGVLLLFGGGLSLAAAMSRTGVASFLGMQFEVLGSWPPWALMIVVAASIVMLTEFTSNIATTAAMLPVLAGVARGAGVHPYLLMLPAVIGASFAFMLPAATAANAIAMGTGRVTLRQMMRAGWLLNLLGTAWICLCCWFLGPLVLGIDLTRFPAEWAG